MSHEEGHGRTGHEQKAQRGISLSLSLSLSPSPPKKMHTYTRPYRHGTGLTDTNVHDQTRVCTRTVHWQHGHGNEFERVHLELKQYAHNALFEGSLPQRVFAHYHTSVTGIDQEMLKKYDFEEPVQCIGPCLGRHLRLIDGQLEREGTDKTQAHNNKRE
jgi:hypothetical protein